MKVKKIAAGLFKAHCLQIMNEIKEKQVSFIITKHGVPVAKLVPIEDNAIDLFGALAGTVKIKGDIIMPIEETWDAEQ